jgi:hypothetical protein
MFAIHEEKFSIRLFLSGGFAVLVLVLFSAPAHASLGSRSTIGHALVPYIVQEVGSFQSTASASYTLPSPVVAGHFLVACSDYRIASGSATISDGQNTWTQVAFGTSSFWYALSCWYTKALGGATTVTVANTFNQDTAVWEIAGVTGFDQGGSIFTTNFMSPKTFSVSPSAPLSYANEFVMAFSGDQSYCYGLSAGPGFTMDQTLNPLTSCDAMEYANLTNMLSPYSPAPIVFTGAFGSYYENGIYLSFHSDIGPHNALVFSTQPSPTGIAGAVLAQQPVVQIQHSGSLLSSASAKVTLAAYSDSTCGTPVTGTFSIAANSLPTSAGSVGFSGISYTKAQTFYLGASAPGYTPACSSGIAITAAAPAVLSFPAYSISAEPVGKQYPWLVQPAVSVADMYGNAVSGAPVTLAAYNDSACSTTPASGSLSATSNPVSSAASGTATFAGVQYSQGDTLYLQATSPGVPQACSPAIIVSDCVGSRTVYTTPTITGTFVVGASCTTIHAKVWGAGGGGGGAYLSTWHGGDGGTGGLVTAKIPVVAGETLNFKVGAGGGGGGGAIHAGIQGLGGAPGGGNGSTGGGNVTDGRAGGGGWSGILRSGAYLLVGGAGGGGGAEYASGGTGGYPYSTPYGNGSQGSSPGGGSTGGGGGGGGTQSAGGSAGLGYYSTGGSGSSGAAGLAGTIGAGGIGGAGNFEGGGGGGGGYYGGGGGGGCSSWCSSGGGAGGGSSYSDPANLNTKFVWYSGDADATTSVSIGGIGGVAAIGAAGKDGEIVIYTP